MGLHSLVTTYFGHPCCVVGLWLWLWCCWLLYWNFLFVCMGTICGFGGWQNLLRTSGLCKFVVMLMCLFISFQISSLQETRNIWKHLVIVFFCHEHVTRTGIRALSTRSDWGTGGLNHLSLGSIFSLCCFVFFFVCLFFVLASFFPEDLWCLAP